MKTALPDLSHLNILLAEDNLTNQLVATQMLESMGARTTLASDGVEALERFEESSFDILLLDIEMPRMSGLDVMRAIRGRSDGRADVPIIALTAYALDEHRSRIRDAGADGLIPKPILGLEDLGNGILSHLPQSTPSPEGSAKTAEAVSSAAQIDRAVFDMLRDAVGPEVIGELLEKVEEDIKACLPALKSENGNFDIAELRAKTHILISVAGAIGASGLQNLARSLNTAAHDAPGAGLTPLAAQALAEADEVLNFVAIKQGELA